MVVQDYHAEYVLRGQFFESIEQKLLAELSHRLPPLAIKPLFCRIRQVKVPFALQSQFEAEFVEHKGVVQGIGQYEPYEPTQASASWYEAGVLSRLYEGMRRQSQYFQALYEASKAIATGFTRGRTCVLDSIVEQAVERITGVYGPKATWGAIQLYDEETNELVFESVYAPKTPSLKSRLGEHRLVDQAKAPDGKVGIIGRVALTKGPQLVNDVRTDPDYVEFDPATKSELAVPLLDEDKIVGVLSVESDQLGAFDEEHEQGLRALAELAVIAVKNAERAEQLSRTNAVAVMGAWGADVVHDVNREVGAIRRITFALQQQSGLPAQVKDGLQKVDTYAASLALPELPEEPLQTGRIWNSAMPRC